jgi:hypothetical protein
MDLCDDERRVPMDVGHELESGPCIRRPHGPPLVRMLCLPAFASFEPNAAPVIVGDVSLGFGLLCRTLSHRPSDAS